jgi:hypothetical protein
VTLRPICRSWFFGLVYVVNYLLQLFPCGQALNAEDNLLTAKGLLSERIPKLNQNLAYRLATRFYSG